MDVSSFRIREKEAEDWLSSNSPRLFDLYQWSNKGDPKNYFKELFPIAYLGWESYVHLEKTRGRLDSAAWEQLRDKALPYVTADDARRRHQQLISTLDEARGYVFLADQGYDRIEFIKPKNNKKGHHQSPDLAAIKSGSTAILEVKTFNESDPSLGPDAPWRHQATKVRQDLSDEFKAKLVSTIEQARKQLNGWPHASDRKIVLLVVRFDIGQKTSAQSYAELESFIASQPMQDGIEVYHQATY